MQPSKKFMGVFLLAMMNVSVMVSLRNLPLVAEYGLGAAFLFLLVGITFFVPVALISAELATGWPRDGGIYVWVREAFGPFWGFFAVWMQWVHNVTWYPAILSFSAATLAIAYKPELATNPTYLFFFVILGFWGFTLFNYFKIRTSTLFSAFSVVAGTILPGVILILLALLWTLRGDPIQIPLTWQGFIPPFDNIQHLVFLAGLFLAFGGIEVSAVYARDVENPKKSFPIAILTAGFISFILYTLGSLSISVMIPKSEISLLRGLMDAFASLLGNFGLAWAFVPLALLIVISALGELNAWIIGPVQALHATTHNGDLPPVFQKLNKHERPFNLLLFQAIIVTLAAFAFFFLPTASSAFWILSAMAAQIYLVMYILLIMSGIKLRYSHPEVERKYKVPFGKVGIWILGIIGIAASLFGFFIGFVPPSQLMTGSLAVYETFMITGIVLMAIIPYIIFKFRHPRWNPEK